MTWVYSAIVFSLNLCAFFSYQVISQSYSIVCISFYVHFSKCVHILGFFHYACYFKMRLKTGGWKHIYCYSRQSGEVIAETVEDYCVCVVDVQPPEVMNTRVDSAGRDSWSSLWPGTVWTSQRARSSQRRASGRSVKTVVNIAVGI